MNRGKTEQETLELNGWGVGTRLIGWEGWAGGGGNVTVIEVTYLTGDGSMLARIISSESTTGRSERDSREESFWTLGCREWREDL